MKLSSNKPYYKLPDTCDSCTYGVSGANVVYGGNKWKGVCGYAGMDDHLSVVPHSSPSLTHSPLPDGL